MLQVAFFLDYDGTLTPLVSNPGEATLSEEARDVVRALALLFPTAIVTGRTKAKAHDFVQIDDLWYPILSCQCCLLACWCQCCLLVPMLPAVLPACMAVPNPTVCRYAGSHGFDIGRGLSDSDFGYTIASSYQPAMDEALEQLAALLADVEGLVIEDNTFSISVHYRNVDEAIRPQVDLAVQEVQCSVVRAAQCSELQYSAVQCRPILVLTVVAGAFHQTYAAQGGR